MNELIDMRSNGLITII